MTSRLILCAAALVLVSARTAAAQPAPAFEVSGSYAAMNDAMNEIDFPLGWVAGAAVRLAGWLSAAGEVGGSYAKESLPGSDVSLHEYTFMAGLRASVRIGRFTEFGQFLAGTVYTRSTLYDTVTTEQYGALQPGGGADFRLTSSLAARGEADLRMTHIGRQFRFVAALVYTRP